jgi:hypothetical protein
MSARKPKSSVPSPIDQSAERLQLRTVSVEPNTAPGYQPQWHCEQRELPTGMPASRKNQLH